MLSTDFQFNRFFVLIDFCRYIEIKGPVEQRVVYQELKSLYAISFTSIAEDPTPISTSPPPPPICPYIIKFYGTFLFYVISKKYLSF